MNTINLALIIYVQGFLLFTFFGMAYRDNPSIKDLLIFGLTWPKHTVVFLYKQAKRLK